MLILLVALIVSPWPDFGRQVAGWAGSALVAALTGELQHTPPLEHQPQARR